jgi:hypothetical protein
MMKMMKVLPVCFLMLATTAKCDDYLSLDKLTDCQGLASIQMMLRGKISTDCRQPRNALERAVESQFAVTTTVDSCLLSSPPTARLAGFSCFEIMSNQQRELACFKPVHKSQLDDYLGKYAADYRDKVLLYLQDARKCPVGNGDAGAAPNTLLPAEFNSISQVRFAFALEVGSEKKSQIYHAFADTDPETDRGGPGAIEVFDFLNVSKASVIQPSACQSKNGIVLTMDDAQEGRRSVESTLTRQTASRATVKMRFIDLTYCGTENVSDATKISDLNDWQDQLKYVLAVTDYRELDEDELANSPFKNTDEMRDLMAKNLPFAQRNGNRTLGPHVVFLVDDVHQQCAAVAEVMVLEPESEVKTDYGSIAILLLGVGDCRIAQKPGGTLSDQLLNKLTDEVRSDAVK